MLRTLRVTVLLFILFMVAMNTWLARLYATDWSRPLRVVITPINADGSAASTQYIDTLTPASFMPIENFFRREIARYGRSLHDPLDIRLAPPIAQLPPEPPRDPGVLPAMLWSLRMRYWAWRADDPEGPPAQVRLFVKYHDPSRYRRLAHSVGLEKGMIGLINAYASPQMTARNNVVIAHELMHTLGATDKYDPHTNQPLYPQGYASPGQHPLLPQRQAEIMGGRVPVTATRSHMPDGLGQVVVGPWTAREINWID